MNVVARIFVGARRKGRFAPFARKSRRVPRIFWPIRQDLSLPPVRRFALPYGVGPLSRNNIAFGSLRRQPRRNHFVKLRRALYPSNRSSGEDRGGGKLHHARRLHRNVSLGDRCVAGAGDRPRMSIIFQGASRISRVYIREYTSDECPGHGLYVMEETVKILISRLFSPTGSRSDPFGLGTVRRDDGDKKAKGWRKVGERTVTGCGDGLG